MHRPAQQIRTTMAVYFLIGAALSLVGLLIAVTSPARSCGPRSSCSPPCCSACSSVRCRAGTIPADVVRPAVLVVSAASALVLLVRSLMG